MVWLYAQSRNVAVYDNVLAAWTVRSAQKLVVQTTGIAMAVSTAIGSANFSPVRFGNPAKCLCTFGYRHDGRSDARQRVSMRTNEFRWCISCGTGLSIDGVCQSAVFFSDTPNLYLRLQTTLHVITWVGAITAVFAASIAVAQNDINAFSHTPLFRTRLHDDGSWRWRRRVGMVSSHYATRFQGAVVHGRGSVIHGCHEEQDIRYMGA